MLQEKWNASYHYPKGGLAKPQTLSTSSAIFTESYMIMPASVLSDIVVSNLPFWERSRFWILARPLSGFAETFSQYIAEVLPNGGSLHPETNKQAQSAIFVVDGCVDIVISEQIYRLETGGFAYIPPSSDWQVRNSTSEPVRFHWIRKTYEHVDGLEAPESFFRTDQETAPTPMLGHESSWLTTHFMDRTDIRHDMHIAIVTFMPGGAIPFMETHVMEHGLYVLQGKGVYRLNDTWVEVGPGDFMWLRAFCPQACYAGGPGPFRYLLYKDVNRHARLWN